MGKKTGRSNLDEEFFEQQRREIFERRKARGLGPPKDYVRLVFDEYGRIVEYQRGPDDPIYVRKHTKTRGVVDKIKPQKRKRKK
jgi:hypothetical protein